MSKGFSIKIKKNGGFATGRELQQAFEDSAGAHWRIAGFSLQRAEQVASPVKSGALRASWETGEPFWQGHRFLIRVGTNIRYAQAANMRSSKPGYIEAGVEAARQIVMQNLADGVRAVQLWRR